MTTLFDALIDELLRVRVILVRLEDLGPHAHIAATWAKASIEKARQALRDQDLAAMIRALEDLKTYDA